MKIHITLLKGKDLNQLLCYVLYLGPKRKEIASSVIFSLFLSFCLFRLRSKVLWLLVNYHCSQLLLKARLSVKKPKLHPFINVLVPYSGKLVSGHGLQFHILCNVYITWIYLSNPVLDSNLRRSIGLKKILLVDYRISTDPAQEIDTVLYLSSPAPQNWPWKKEVALSMKYV